jgi:S-formylglutathione hydrolase FrmB
LAALAVTATVAVAPAAPAGAQPPPLPAPDSHGVTLVSPLTQVGGEPRLVDATLRTAAILTPRGVTTPADVSVPVKVRILLPEGYDPDRAAPYDVLYLLHGGGGTWADWSTSGDVIDTIAAAEADFDGIVVMPEGGRAGWYSDWPGKTDGNFAPRWETFHIGQLVPWIDANFNTSGTRSGRAIAGLSMGGYGALRYAGRYDQVFSAVGAFSAGTDIRPTAAQDIVSNSMWQAGAAIDLTGLLDGKFRVNPPWFSGIDARAYRMDAVFGPVAGRAAVNPAQMASRYNAYDGNFALYAGGLDGNGGETDIGHWSSEFHGTLVRAGVDHRWCGGAGAHDFASWKLYLTDFIDYAYGDATATSPCPN